MLVDHIDPKSAESIWPELQRHIRYYEKFGRKVNVVMSDPKRGVDLLKAKIQTVPSKPTFLGLSKGEHTVNVDTAMKSGIKYSLCTMIARCPFPVGGLLLIGFVMF